MQTKSTDLYASFIIRSCWSTYKRGLQLKLIGVGYAVNHCHQIMQQHQSLNEGYEPVAYFKAVKSFKLRNVLSTFSCGQHGLGVQPRGQAQVCIALKREKVRDAIFVGARTSRRLGVTELYHYKSLQDRGAPTYHQCTLLSGR